MVSALSCRTITRPDRDKAADRESAALSRPKRVGRMGVSTRRHVLAQPARRTRKTK